MQLPFSKISLLPSLRKWVSIGDDSLSDRKIYRTSCDITPHVVRRDPEGSARSPSSKILAWQKAKLGVVNRSKPTLSSHRRRGEGVEVPSTQGLGAKGRLVVVCTTTFASTPCSLMREGYWTAIKCSHVKRARHSGLAAPCLIKRSKFGLS